MKDAAGRNHRSHLEAITFHNTMATIMWQMMDVIHHPSGDSGAPAPNVLLARLAHLETIEQNLHNYSVGQMLELGLNCVHEVAHLVYIKHVYNDTVATTFLGIAF